MFLESFLRNLLEAAIKPTLDNLLLDFVCDELGVCKHKGSLQEFEEVVFHIFEVCFDESSHFLQVFFLLRNLNIFI